MGFGEPGDLVVRSTAPVTLAQAKKIYAERLEHMDTNGDLCEAIRLRDETPEEWETLAQQEVDITLKGGEVSEESIHLALAEALKVEPEQVVSWTLYDPSKEYRGFIETSVAAVAPKEKTETRYFIVFSDQETMPKWETGYKSQTEARAALGTISLPLLSQWSIPEKQAEIISITRRASGEPLVSATISAKQFNGTFTVWLRRKVKEATVGTGQSGWFFYGWAYC